MFFSPFSIAITSLGEERANRITFRALVRFCLFPLPLGVWERLRFVIAAFPGLYLTFVCIHKATQVVTRPISYIIRSMKRVIYSNYVKNNQEMKQS